MSGQTRPRPTRRRGWGGTLAHLLFSSQRTFGKNAEFAPFLKLGSPGKRGDGIQPGADNCDFGAGIGESRECSGDATGVPGPAAGRTATPRDRHARSVARALREAAVGGA